MIIMHTTDNCKQFLKGRKRSGIHLYMCNIYFSFMFKNYHKIYYRLMILQIILRLLKCIFSTR